MDLPSSTVRAWQLYGGAIESAVRAGATTADVWAGLRAAASSLGVPLTGISAADVSRLRGVYGAMVRAESALAGLGEDEQIGSAQIGQAPWSSALAVQAATPRYLVRLKLFVPTEDNPNAERWASVYYTGPLSTLDDLRTDLAADVATMAENYLGEVAGFGIDSLVAA